MAAVAEPEATPALAPPQTVEAPSDTAQPAGAASAPGTGQQVAAVAPDFDVPPASALPARGIVGRAVYGADSVKVGTVKDVVLGGDGRAVAAMVSVGGFLGFGGHDVAIPLDRLLLGEGGRLTTTLARDALDPPPSG